MIIKCARFWHSIQSHLIHAEIRHVSIFESHIDFTRKFIVELFDRVNASELLRQMHNVPVH